MKTITNLIFLLNLIILLFISGSCQENTRSKTLIRPGHAEWPRAWVSYSKIDSVEKDFIDLKEHGVGIVSMSAVSLEDARKKLDLARKYGMKFHIQFNKINERRDLVQEMGLEPVDALMIGGIYKGMAIDRFLFEFSASKHSIIVEPPVYNAHFAYRSRQQENLKYEDREPNSHYFPDIPPPVKAEIIIPLMPYDGQQHLKVISYPGEAVAYQNQFESEIKDKEWIKP